MADAATISVTLTDSYQEIITGPCAITVEQGIGVLFRYASSAPAESDPGHSIFVAPGQTANAPYPGNLTVYAKIHPRFQHPTTKTVLSVTGV